MADRAGMTLFPAGNICGTKTEVTKVVGN